MNIHKIRHFIKEYYTLDNIVLFAAVLMALGFIWSTMGALQNNYRLQDQVSVLRSQVEAARLESETLQLENSYFASEEYIELRAREQFGKAFPGEHMIILPANTVSDDTFSQQKSPKTYSNLQAWFDFFFSNR